MFVRFVQIRVRPEQLQELRRLYEDEIIPVLQSADGCFFVGLIQNTQHPDECISMTLWTEKERAADYERSGAYGRLVRTSQPYFADSSEWRIHLSDDLTLTYTPVPQEPVVQAFRVSSDSTIPPAGKMITPFIRIVSHQVNSGMKKEFVNIYNLHILPALRQVPGCQQAYLIENNGEADKLLSMTVWQSREAALEYEHTGVFDSLIDKLRPTLSGVYQWKMQLQHETGAQVVSTADIAVDGYTVVASRSFPQNSRESHQ
jgi:quinol monooxygenase YgiN